MLIDIGQFGSFQFQIPLIPCYDIRMGEDPCPMNCAKSIDPDIGQRRSYSLSQSNPD
jgi:hypothetical protein